MCKYCQNPQQNHWACGISSSVPAVGALPTMAYMGRLRLKGVPFRLIKRWGFHKLRNMKG